MGENMPAKSRRTASGKARAASMTAEERSEASRRAALARWEPVPEAVCGSSDAPLRIGDADIECYVLEDGRRVLTQGDFLKAFGRHRTVRKTDDSDDALPPIIQGKALRPFLPEGIAERAAPIPFRTTQGAKAHGYPAELLPEVCEAFLSARDAEKLPANQRHIADRAAILVRGLARVGIIALVDEATGYQEVRTRNALEKILADYVDSELQAYLKTFPDDYYKELFRLHGLPYSADSTKRPVRFGKFTNEVVYRRLAPGVLDELKKAQTYTDAGHPKHKLFQRLTQNVGYPKLREHLGSVVTIMKLSEDWADFKQKLDRLHPKYEQEPLFE